MIRSLTHEDHTALCDLIIPFYKDSHYSRHGVYDEHYAKEFISEFIGASLGCFVDDSLVGFITVNAQYEFHDRPHGYLTHFFVSPDYRYTDTGRKLVESALEVCNNINCLTVCVSNTWDRGSKGQALFRNLMAKYGFNHLGNTMIKDF